MRRRCGAPPLNGDVRRRYRMNCIAERRLALRVGDDSREVLVQIGAPEIDGSGADWKCPYLVSCGEHSHAWRMHGIDAIQALLLALSTIDVELEVLAKKCGGKLFYLDAPFTTILENGGVVKAPPAATLKP
jgi:hypothetical protein